MAADSIPTDASLAFHRALTQVVVTLGLFGVIQASSHSNQFRKTKQDQLKFSSG